MTKEYEDFLKAKLPIDVPTGLKNVPPLNEHLFPFQAAIVSWALRRGRAAIFAGTGLGKALRNGTGVLTPDGFVPIESLRVGDAVYGQDGKQYNVRGVFPQGVRPLYRITFSDGQSVECDEDHLWLVRNKKQNAARCGGTIRKTREIADMRLRGAPSKKSSAGARCVFVPVNEPIAFAGTDRLPIDPYTLGAILGDGSIAGFSPTICTDVEIMDSLVMPEGVRLVRNSRGDRWPSGAFSAGGNHWNDNALTASLRALGLWGTRSETKFVPRPYLFASYEDRIALLRGLLDTDGYAHPTEAEYSTASSQLAADVAFVARSLGCVVACSIRERPTYRYRGETKVGQPSHRVRIKAPFPLFSLARKAINMRPRKSVCRAIESIERVGFGEATCISVDSPDSLFVCEGFTVTHNTLMQLEFAQHVPGNVLVLAPLAVAHQTVNEGAKFDIDVRFCREQSEVEDGITITNYHNVHKFDPKAFAGIVLDESSIIKSQDGHYRKNLIESFASTPYRLACTATPAPNDFMELGNHAEFLGVMSHVEMLSMFFVHDGGETQKWRLKGHAQDAFWKWIASWAVLIRKPSDIGFEDKGYELPPLIVEQESVRSKKTLPGFLFPMAASTLQDRIKARAETVEDRVRAAAEIVASKPDEQWIVWCGLNAESALATKLIADAVEVKGGDSDEHKERAMLGFAAGNVRVIVTKPSIAGFGMNWQNCANMVFVGLNDSWESYYQAVRRCWRFGQTRSVNVWLVTADIEGAVLRNLGRKEEDAIRMSSEMVKHMEDAMKENLGGLRKQSDMYKREHQKSDRFEAYLGDCVEVTRELESDSMHYSIFSPPFSSLYTYSNSERDMGNCKGDTEFFAHFRFLLKELYRLIKPGRLMSQHVMNLPTSKQNHGYIGIRDFRGDVIRACEAEGFIFHSEVVVWKDPVTAMQRTKALGLLHKQLKKDACMSRQGIPDYLVTFRKPGDNPEPVSNTNESFPVELWQRYASPVWMDINPSDTLQHRSAREHNDERHICPLQLEVIRRALKLWTNEGDIVLSPFMGIGSEGHVSLQMGRRFVGIELKESYYKQAVKNLKIAQTELMPLFANAETTDNTQPEETNDELTGLCDLGETCEIER